MACFLKRSIYFFHRESLCPLRFRTYEKVTGVCSACNQGRQFLLLWRRCRIRDVEHLKEVPHTCWEQIGQDVINRSMGQFRKRLSLVVATDEEHTEHRFDYFHYCFGATCTLSHLCVLLYKYRTWTTKVNSPVYFASLCNSSSSSSNSSSSNSQQL